MRLTGNLAPQFFTAARTRSRASRTAASGRPTTVSYTHLVAVMRTQGFKVYTPLFSV